MCVLSAKKAIDLIENCVSLDYLFTLCFRLMIRRLHVNQASSKLLYNGYAA